MKTPMIIVVNGRVTIPKEIMRELGWKDGTQLMVALETGKKTPMIIEANSPVSIGKGMKIPGIIVVDGRVTIPKEIMRELGWKDGTQIMGTDERGKGSILLSKI